MTVEVRAFGLEPRGLPGAGRYKGCENLSDCLSVVWIREGQGTSRAQSTFCYVSSEQEFQSGNGNLC